MNNPCKNARLFVLVIAAAIQYVGASAKRQFLYLVKLLVIVLPGMKDFIDNKFKIPVDSGTEIYNNGLKKISSIISIIGGYIYNEHDLPNWGNKDSGLKAASKDNTLFELISDFLVDLLLWFLSFFVSILALLGVLIESATGLVADLLRLICNKRGNVTPATFLKDSLKEFMSNIRDISDALAELADANIRWYIVPTVTNTENDSNSYKNNKASAFSFSAQGSNYIDSGVRYDFLLVNGEINYGRQQSGVLSLKLINNPHIIKYPFKMQSTGWSFHKKREGIKRKKLKFDMVTASSDRIFVKVEGKSDFYFATMDELFWDDNSKPIPSIYFKLDPQFGETGTDGSLINPSSLVDQISDSNKYTHSQAERLPIFHATIGMGILDAMVVAVKPKTWYRLDTRPPHYGNDVSFSNGDDIFPDYVPIFPALNTQYKTRIASNYKGTSLSGGELEEISKDEFEFSEVLSLGVGNYHYYESWVDDYGGELQPLHHSDPFNLPINMSLYGLFNGPLWDGDGAVDGTCNFYILVKLDKSEEIQPDNYCYDHDDCYGILWCDEQTYFTKRWRLLDPRDNEPWEINIPHDINLSLTAALRRDKESGLLNQQYNFDYGEYLASDPFQQGWINENSRMAVARQIIIVSGIDKNNISKLFSINFSYGSIDRRWRSRPYPKNAVVLSGMPSERTLNGIHHWDSSFDHSAVGLPQPHHLNQHLHQSSIYPETLHIREDMTISIRGYKNSILGRWFQRYLPCTRQHPEIDDYNHPWNFLPEKAFQRADVFSHFGVYDQVDSRNQYYIVEVVESSRSFTCPVNLRDWKNVLSIRGIKFNWGLFKDIDALESFLEDGDDKTLPVSIRNGDELNALSEKLLFRWDHKKNGNYPYENQYRESRTSAHNEHATFRLLDRGPLGYIMVWDDKRDDDLISLSDLPKEVLMKGHGGLLIKLRIVRNKRITSLPNVKNVSLSLLENDTKLQILIETEQNEIDAIENLWAIRIAALPESGNPDYVLIYEAENLLKHEDFTINYDANSNWLTLEGKIKINASHSDYLDDKGALKHATRVWFEDIVGHVSTSDSLKFI